MAESVYKVIELSVPARSPGKRPPAAAVQPGRKIPARTPLAEVAQPILQLDAKGAIEAYRAKLKCLVQIRGRVKRWGDRRTAVEVTERRELLQASEVRLVLLLSSRPAKASALFNSYHLPMKTNDERPKSRCLSVRALIQISGAMLFVWQNCRVQADSGQSRRAARMTPSLMLVTVGILFVMQISFWCRLLYIHSVRRRT